MPRNKGKKVKATVGLAGIRTAVADYMWSEGCSCCQGSQHDAHAATIAKMLRVRPYADGSGFNFQRYRTKPSPRKPAKRSPRGGAR